MPTAREAILDLLSKRDEGKTICPSEAARAAQVPMDTVRDAARQLVEEGEIVVTQKGEVVDLAGVRGPIRLQRSTRYTADCSSSALPSSGGQPWT